MQLRGKLINHYGGKYDQPQDPIWFYYSGIWDILGYFIIESYFS